LDCRERFFLFDPAFPDALPSSAGSAARRLPSRQENPMTEDTNPVARAQTPCGLNHVVINVRDLDAAHEFWAGCLGFRQVGAWHPKGTDRPGMRFYSGEAEGKLSHHHIALVEDPALAEAEPGRPQVFNHLAIAYPSRACWEAQLEFLKAAASR
jgi:catechol 2,3-dioxygenase-like lactoylglutathione lyase family enzyme